MIREVEEVTAEPKAFDQTVGGLKNNKREDQI